jgi:phage-related protein
LKSGELPVSFTAAGNLINKYLTEAKPLIRAYGTGTFSIGNRSVQITSADTYTDIDCDLMEAYKDTLATNCNNNIILTDGEFPSLMPGDNLITLSGLSGIEITPRWWVL